MAVSVVSVLLTTTRPKLTPFCPIVGFFAESQRNISVTYCREKRELPASVGVSCGCGSGREPLFDAKVEENVNVRASEGWSLAKTPQANHKLENYFDDLLEAGHFRNRGEIAAAVDMTDSGFSRAVMEEGTLSIETCIKLAHRLKREPGDILRAADRGNGRTKIAEMLEAAYGVRVRFNVTGDEKELIRSWRKMKPVPKAAVESIIHNMGGRTAAVQRARSSGAAKPERPKHGRKKSDRKRRFRAAA